MKRKLTDVRDFFKDDLDTPELVRAYQEALEEGTSRFVAYARALLRAREGLALLPSKANPRVKRWQRAGDDRAAQAPAGKADVVLGEWIDPATIQRIASKKRGITRAFIGRDANGRELYVKFPDPKAVYGKMDPSTGTNVNPNILAARQSYAAHAEVGSSVLADMLGVPSVKYAYLGSSYFPRGTVSEIVPGAVPAGRLYRGWPGPLTFRLLNPYYRSPDPWAKRYLQRFAEYSEKDPDEIANQMGQLMSFGILVGDLFDRHHYNFLVAPGRGFMGVDWGRSFPPHVIWRGGEGYLARRPNGVLYMEGGATYAPEQRVRGQVAMRYPRPVSFGDREMLAEELLSKRLRGSAPTPLLEGYEHVLNEFPALDLSEAARRQGLPDYQSYY